MGTTAEVQAGGAPEPRKALDRAFAALGLVDDQTSLWKESDLLRLNRAGSGVVPPELLAVIRQALDLARASSGAFDPTLEPLVRAMGGLGGPPCTVGDVERRALLLRVGAEHVHVDEATRTIRLDSGTALDLGGIAKGYAADLAIAALRDAGATSGLVDLGGSSLAVFGMPLTVDVRDPESADASPWATFVVENGAVGTSGGDQRPGHILDPRTGQPATGVLSATVVASSASEADALSTAVYVLGAERGLALLAERGLAGFVLERRLLLPTIRTTPGFREAYHLHVRDGVGLD